MNSLKGHLLIASPTLLDPNFVRSVVLMIEHNEQGAAGVVINGPGDTTITQIAMKAFQEPLEWEKLITRGGPVPGPLLALHTSEEHADQEVMAGLYTTAEATKIEALVRLEVEPSRFVINYAGWGPGQLEAELAEESWMTLPARLELVFTADDTELWKLVVNEANRGRLIDMLHLEDVPQDPRLN